MRRASCSKKIIYMALLCFFLTFLRTGNVSGVTVAGVYTTGTEEDDEWRDDLTEKMDKAIKVLNVIKEEIDEEGRRQDSNAPSAAKPQAQPGWGEQLKTKTSQAVKIWNKIKEALRPGGTQPAEQQASDWTENAEENVDKLVKVGEKVEKVMAAYTTDAKEASAGEDEASWSESVKVKIDKTINVLNAVKDELEDEGSNKEDAS